MANWSELPEDIIGLFADRLPHLKDLVRFGAVCRSWSSGAGQAKIRRKPYEPWLVMANRENDKMTSEKGAIRNCYSLFSSNYEVFNLSLPELQGRRCWGTPHGWIVTLGVDSEYHLFNPLTRARFSLPPRSSIRGYCDSDDDYDDDEIMCIGFPGSFALSSNPSESGESVVVMATYGGYRKLAFASPKDKSWTCLTCTSKAADTDILFFRDGRFYTISVEGILRMCDLNTAAGPKTVDIAPPPPGFDSACQFYLAEISENLHLITRDFDLVDEHTSQEHVELSCFNLYRFDFYEAQWIQVNDIGNHSLFLGNNTTFAISTSHHLGSEFKSNCIYFTDDHMEYMDVKHRDMGVYDIGTGAVTEFFPHKVDSPSAFSKPFIFLPSLT